MSAWPDGTGWPSWAFSNHDAPRAVTRWATADDRAALSFTRSVLALRNRQEALANGTLHMLEASDAILAFERQWREERLLCVFNLGTVAHPWKPPAEGRWRIIERTGGPQDWTLPGLTGLVAERV